jgi:hypothetical protein
MVRTSSAVEQPLLVYTGNLPELPEIESAVQQIWMDAVRQDPRLRTQLGLTTPDASAPVPFRLSVTQGADVTSVTLTVLAAHNAIGLGVTMLRDVWKGILLPRLKRRYGTVFRQRAADAEPARELPPSPKKKSARKKAKAKAKRPTRPKRPATRPKKRR